MYRKLCKVLKENFEGNHGGDLIQINKDNKHFDQLLKAFKKMGMSNRGCRDFEGMKSDMERFNEKYIYIDLRDLWEMNLSCIFTSNIRLSKDKFYTCKRMIQILGRIRKEFKN